MKRKNIIILLAILLLSAWLFKSSFTVYFSQDDFFRFKMSKVQGVSDVLRFFLPKNSFQYGFYRPLSINLYSSFGQYALEDNFYLYHIVNYFIYCVNIILVYRLLVHFVKKNDLALWATFIYAVSSFHLTSLSYLSAVEEIFVCFFVLLTTLLYLKRSKFAIFTFVLGLLSRETAIMLPALLLLIEYFNKDNQKKKYLRTTPYFLILFFYLLLRVSNGLLPDTGVYQLTFSPLKIVNNYFWFFLWGMNIPEGLIDFFGPGLKINPRFFEIFPPLGVIILVFASLSILMFLLGALRQLATVKKIKNNLGFFSLWFIVSLLPFVFLSGHKFAFYLGIPFVGIAGLLAITIGQTKCKYLFLLLFFFASLFTTKYNEKTYWAINRAMVSKKAINELKNNFGTLPENTALYFLNDPDYVSPSEDWGGTSTQVKIALSGCNGPEFVFKINHLNCFFEDDGLPKASLKSPYRIIIKLN